MPQQTPAAKRRPLERPQINGALQHRQAIEEALSAGKCDLVSMARPLLAGMAGG